MPARKTVLDGGWPNDRADAVVLNRQTHGRQCPVVYDGRSMNYLRQRLPKIFQAARPVWPSDAHILRLVDSSSGVRFAPGSRSLIDPVQKIANFSTAEALDGHATTPLIPFLWRRLIALTSPQGRSFGGQILGNSSLKSHAHWQTPLPLAPASTPIPSTSGLANRIGCHSHPSLWRDEDVMTRRFTLSPLSAEHN